MDNTPPDTMTPSDRITLQFYRWELRGRGWLWRDYPVQIEPPFEPFRGYEPFVETDPNDGRRPGLLGSIFGSLRSTYGYQSNAQNETALELPGRYDYLVVPSEPDESDEEIKEFVIAAPANTNISFETCHRFLSSLKSCRHPVSFEILSLNRQVGFSFAVRERDSQTFCEQFRGFFPSISLEERKVPLATSIVESDVYMSAAEFGLSEEFLFPIATARKLDLDPLLGIVNVLGGLSVSETGLLQILFTPVRSKWKESISRLAESSDGTSVFGDLPELPKLAAEKVSDGLYAVCIRLLAASEQGEAAWSLIKKLSRQLAQCSDSGSNRLIPLVNEYTDQDEFFSSILGRYSLRCGMLLNTAELINFVHPPTPSIRIENLIRQTENTKPAPNLALNNQLVLGINQSLNVEAEVTLSAEQRTRHMHLIGGSGSGKSTAILSYIKQDLENGEGLCVIDPHGDLIDSVIRNVPNERLKDVILFDPADSEYPIGFNIIQANSELEKNLLSSDLVAAFRRMATSWGDVMDSVLANAILAYVESKKGGTLFELKRFLVENSFREAFLETVEDDAIRYFWDHEFPNLTGKPQSSIIVRLDSFLRNKIVRNIVCQKETRLNFREIMDKRKILLVKLSQGLIGEENSYLMGTFLVSKLNQIALSRQDSLDRPYFWVYIDEFHNFITPTLESILSGIRKYKIGLHLANQSYSQIHSRSPEVANSVLSNCYTRICFRLGDQDADRFASGFSFFDAKALQNLGVGEAIGRIERAEYDFNLKIEQIPKVDEEIAQYRESEIIKNTRLRYARPKSEVEASLMSGRATNEGVEGKDAKDSKKKEAKIEKDKLEESQTTDTSGSISQESLKVTDDLTKQTEKSEVPKNSEHRYLQSIIKRIGEDAGFVATLEKPVFGGIGKIDVALEQDSFKIACEVAVTNSLDYELQNIQKCLASGFEKVVVISSDNKHLSRIKAKTQEILSKENLAKVHFLEPDSFHLFLDSLREHIERDGSKADTNIVKGYKVSITHKAISDSEREAKEKIISEIFKQASKRS